MKRVLRSPIQACFGHRPAPIGEGCNLGERKYIGPTRVLLFSRFEWMIGPEIRRMRNGFNGNSQSPKDGIRLRFLSKI